MLSSSYPEEVRAQMARCLELRNGHSIMAAASRAFGSLGVIVPKFRDDDTLALTAHMYGNGYDRALSDLEALCTKHDILFEDVARVMDYVYNQMTSSRQPSGGGASPSPP